MKALLNELKAWGCDMDGALPRFSYKEDFYARCFKKFVVDPSFVDLGKALEAKDIDAAFQHARTLRELTANMGLTPLHNIVEQLVEPLRMGRFDKQMQSHYAQLIHEMKRYKILAVRDGM